MVPMRPVFPQTLEQVPDYPGCSALPLVPVTPYMESLSEGCHTGWKRVDGVSAPVRRKKLRDREGQDPLHKKSGCPSLQRLSGKVVTVLFFPGNAAEEITPLNVPTVTGDAPHPDAGPFRVMQCKRGGKSSMVFIEKVREGKSHIIPPPRFSQ